MNAGSSLSQQPWRLLVVAPFAPRLDATHGGGRALGELIVQLARRHRVALLHLHGDDEPFLDDAVGHACEVVRQVRRPVESGPARWARFVAGWAEGLPMWVVGWRSRELAAALRSLAEEWRPDVAHFEYHIMGQYQSALRPGTVPRVLRQVDPGTAASGERAIGRRGLERWVRTLDRLAWRRYERAVMHEAEAVVALTERDAVICRALAPAARVECIPLATEIPREPLDPAGTGGPQLLFVGNFVHPPNLDAAVRLAHDVFPHVQAAYPAASLYLVGPDPEGRAAGLAGNGVVVTGEVPDVRPFLDRAAAVVVPLRLGGGMRVKVMEALAAGKAVVASPLAIEGLRVAGGEQVVVATTDDEFADAAVGLLADPDRRAALGRAARTWAVENLGWEPSLAKLEALYASLIAR